jgi:hypothetical protein
MQFRIVTWSAAPFVLLSLAARTARRGRDTALRKVKAAAEAREKELLVSLCRIALWHHLGVTSCLHDSMQLEAEATNRKLLRAQQSADLNHRKLL